MPMTRRTGSPVVHLESRLEFETLLADLSSRFIDLPPGEVDHEIEDALRRVCEVLGIDLAVLWQWKAETPDAIIPTHLYPRPNGPEDLTPLHQGQYPWYVRQMLAGHTIAVSSLDELPEEAAVDKGSSHVLGVKSNLCLPLSVGGEPPVGALGLSTIREERKWPEEQVKRLQLVGQVFTNALARKRHELSLRESEERLALAADAAGAGLWTLDHGTGVFWATDRGRVIFGYSPDEVITMERFEASVHPDDRALVRGAIERSAQTGEALNVEYRVIHPGDGRERWIASRGQPRLRPSGELDRLAGVSVDVTERKLAEEASRRSERRLAAGAELAGLGFYEVDLSGGTMWVDDRVREVFGIPPDREVGLQALQFWMEHIHPDDARAVLDRREDLHESRRARLDVEYRYLHPTRGETWIAHVARVAERDAAGRTVKSFGVLRDVTAVKRTEEALHDLSRRLIRAHEEERAMLARELHDDLTQRLAVLAIDVGRAELAAADAEQAGAMRSVREALVRLSEDVHALAYQLHPSVLDELGLAAALHAECERRGRQGALALQVAVEPLSGEVDKDAALCLFRVAQEALTNATRHGGARSASVTLRQMDGGLLLAVRDDGVGFDPSKPAKRRSLGLASMRERVRLVNGTLDVESAPGRGTAVVAWVPLGGDSE